jgi:hypothetical protein
VTSCASGYTEVGNVCVADTQTKTCTGLPANAQWNIVPSILQTRDGSKWSPSSIGTHNITPSITECRFKCNANYARNGSSCEKA